MRRQRNLARVVASVLIALSVVATPALAQDCPQPIGRWSLEFPWQVGSAVAVSGDHLYLGSGRLTIADVSNPSSPTPLGFVDLPRVSGAQNVVVTGGYAYVTEGYDGLRGIDLSTPSAPVQVTPSFNVDPSTTFYSWDVAVSGGYVFVADDLGGLAVYRECGANMFSDGFESGDTTARSATVP